MVLAASKPALDIQNFQEKIKFELQGHRDLAEGFIKKEETLLGNDV